MGNNNSGNIDQLSFDILVRENGFDKKLEAMEKVAKRFNISVSDALNIASKADTSQRASQQVRGLKKDIDGLNQSLNTKTNGFIDIEAQAAKVMPRINELKEKIDVINAIRVETGGRSSENLAKELKDAEREANRLIDSIEVLEHAQKSLNRPNAFNQYISGISRTSIEMQQLIEYYKAEERAATRAAKARNSASMAGTGGFKEYISGLSAKSDTQKQMSAYYKELEKTTASNAKASEGARRFSAQQELLSKSTNRANANFTLQGRALSNLTTLFTSYVSIFAVERLVSNIARVRGEFELQQVALRAIIQDAQAADTIFSQIKGLAIESPFQFKELTGYVKQLAAFSIETDKLFDTTSRLADISAGLGVDMGRIILAYGQVRSASVLRGQELRQFTEAGIPLVDQLAKKFGELEGRVVSAGEVFEKISNRQVSFGMVDEIFSDLTSEGGMFFEMQAKQAETLAGKLSNLTDAYEIMLNEIGMANDGILKGGIDGLRSLMENWRGVGTALMTVVAVYGAYKVASALNTQMLGAENQELIKRLLANKEMIASELRKKAVYTTLSEEEIALTRNTNALTSADLRNLAANGLLTKSAALRMIATKQLTAAHGAELVSLNLITQAELTQALATTRLGRAKLALAGVIGKVGGAFKALWVTMLSNPLTWIVVAVQGVISLFSTMSEHAKAIDEINNKFSELSKRVSSIYGAFSKASGENLFDDQKKQLRALLDLAKEDYRLELDIDFTKLTPQNIIEEFNRLRNELLNAEVFLRTFSKEWQDSTEWTMQDDINEDLQQLGGSSMAFFDLLKGNVNNTIGVLEEYKGKLNEVQLLALESLKTPQKKDETQLQYLERLAVAYKTTYGSVASSLKSFEAARLKTFSGAGGSVRQYDKQIEQLQNTVSKFAVNDKFNTFFSNFNKDLVEGRTEFDNFIKTIENGVNQLPEEKRSVYLKAAIEKQASENNWNEFVRDYVTKWTNEKFNLTISFIPETPNTNLADWQKSLNEKLNNLGYKEAVVKIHLETSQGGFSEARAKVISTYQKEKQGIDELNKAKKQGLAYDDGALSTLRTKLEIQRKKAHLMGISDEELDGKGGKGKDPLAEKIKNQIDLLKRAEGQYEKYLKIASKSDAIKSVLGDAQFKSLGVDFKDYSPEGTRKYLEQIYNSIKDNPRFKEAKELLDKLLSDRNYDDAKKAVDDFLAAIQSEIENYKSDFDFYKTVLGITGDKELSANIAFNATGTDVGLGLVETLKKKLQEATKGEFSFDDLLTFSPEKLKELPDGIQKMFEETKKVIEKSTQDSYLSLVKLVEMDVPEGSGLRFELSGVLAKMNTDIRKAQGELQQALSVSAGADDAMTQTAIRNTNLRIKATQKEAEERARKLGAAFIQNEMDVAGLGNAFKEMSSASIGSLKEMQKVLNDIIKTEIKSFDISGALAGAGFDEAKIEAYKGLFTDLFNFENISEYIEKVEELSQWLDGIASGTITQPFVKPEDIAGLKTITTTLKGVGVSSKNTKEDMDKLVFKKTMKTFGDLASKSKDVIKGVRDISKAFGIAEDSVTDNVLGILETTMDSATSVIDTLASTATSATAGMAGASASAVAAVQAVETASVILAIIAAVMQVISAIVKVIMANTGDALKDKEIEKSEQQLKRLENAYADLERAMDKALGDDKFKAHGKMLNNLSNQMTETSKQADLERSKKEKDGDKINDLERQYVELGYQIDDLLTSIKDDIIGSTAKDIAQELGDAIFEAFANGTDAAEAWGAKVDEIIERIIKNMIISKLIEGPMGKVLDKFFADIMPKTAEAEKTQAKINEIQEEINDLETSRKERNSRGKNKAQLEKERDELIALQKKQLKDAKNEVPNITEDSVNSLKDGMTAAGDVAKTAIENFPDWLKEIMLGNGEAGEGLKEGIKGVTEDTASLLASYLNAIRQHVATQGISLSSTERNTAIIVAAVQNMNWLMGDSRAMVTQGILHLKNIEANTFNTAAEAKAIAESSVKTMKAVLDIVTESRSTNSILSDVTSGVKSFSMK